MPQNNLKIQYKRARGIKINKLFNSFLIFMNFQNHKHSLIMNLLRLRNNSEKNILNYVFLSHLYHSLFKFFSRKNWLMSI